MSHVIGSRYLGDAFTTPEVRQIFEDDSRLQRWLDVEAALARAQGKLDIIPADAAREISGRAHLEQLDRDLLVAEMAATGHTLVPLIRALQHACQGELGQWVHYGATTQDIQDTGSILAIRRVLDLVSNDVRVAIHVLLSLAEKHKSTMIAGRTHGQHALPTTFGYRMVVWARELIRHLQRIEQARPRILVLSLFGGVGTMSALPRGRATLACVAEDLGLAVPMLSWHASRDRVTEFVMLLSLIAASCGTIANQVYELSKSEICEVSEGHRPDILSSSTMPHKRNPEGAEQVCFVARLAKYSATKALDAMLVEHERDGRAWRMELAFIPEISCYTSACVRGIIDVLGGLRVHTQRMRENMEMSAQGMMSERLMMALASRLGKQDAYLVLRDVLRDMRGGDSSLVDAILDHESVRDHFTRDVLEPLMDPQHSLGDAVSLIEHAIVESHRWLEATSRTPGS